MKSLENDKDLIKKLRFDTNTIVFYMENIPVSLFPASYFNLGCPVTAIFQRIANKINEQLPDKGLICPDNGQGFYPDRGITFFDVFIKHPEHIVYCIIQVCIGKLFLIRTNP